jgi:hypothetical protein
MLTRLRHAIGEQGLCGVLVGKFAQFVTLATNGRMRLVWYVLVAQPVRTDWRVPSKLGRSISVRYVDRADELMAQAPRPAAVIAARFKQGATCIAAERNGELVGYLWLCADRYAEDEVRCTFILPDRIARWWDFDVWVRQDQRTGIVFALLWREAHIMMNALGVQWTCSRIARLNPGSLAAHRRLGAMVVGHALFFLGDRRQVMITTPARLHYSPDTSDVPEILVSPPLRASRSSDASS